MEKINGKVYPLWSQFVDKKDEWIGGILEELEDSFPQLSQGGSSQTKITDITLKPNGKEHAYFSVDGEDYGCGGITDCLGIVAGENGWITLSGYGGHRWRIKKAELSKTYSQEHKMK